MSQIASYTIFLQIISNRNVTKHLPVVNFDIEKVLKFVRRRLDGAPFTSIRRRNFKDFYWTSKSVIENYYFTEPYIYFYIMVENYSHPIITIRFLTLYPGPKLYYERDHQNLLQCSTISRPRSENLNAAE